MDALISTARDLLNESQVQSVLGFIFLVTLYLLFKNDGPTDFPSVAVPRKGKNPIGEALSRGYKSVSLVLLSSFKLFTYE